MRSVSKRACTKVTGCPAFSCKDENCAEKNISVHHPPIELTDDTTAIKNNHRWYYQKQWKMIRESHLSRKPLCQRCRHFGFVTGGEHVDHVIAHNGDPKLFFDITNLQTLCHSCHSAKTAAERKGEVWDHRQD